MIIKGRSPDMRHVPRTHRVNLEWLFVTISLDSSISQRYVHTTQQIADIFNERFCVARKVG